MHVSNKQPLPRPSCKSSSVCKKTDEAHEALPVHQQANCHSVACNYLLGQMGDSEKRSGLVGGKVTGLVKRHEESQCILNQSLVYFAIGD